MTKTSTWQQTLQRLDHAIQAQEWETARPLADTIGAQRPTTPGVLERVILVLRQQEDWPALVDQLLLARNQYQLWPAGSDLLMGQAMVELGEWQKAIPYLDIALEQEPNAGWSHHFLGKALRHVGRLEEALAYQQQASRILETFAWAPFEAAQVLIELKRPREAALELQEARRRDGGNDLVIEEQWQRLQPTILAERVEQLITAENITEAFSVLRHAFSLAPDDEDLNQLLTQLLEMPQREDASSINLMAIEQEMNAIEKLLDQLEAQAQSTLDPGELTYL